MIGLLRWARRNLGLVAELAAYGFWLLFDAVIALWGGSAIPLLAGTAVAAIVLMRRRPRARLIPVATVAIAVSILISLLATNPLLRLLGASSAPFYLSFT